MSQTPLLLQCYHGNHSNMATMVTPCYHGNTLYYLLVITFYFLGTFWDVRELFYNSFSVLMFQRAAIYQKVVKFCWVVMFT